LTDLCCCGGFLVVVVFGGGGFWWWWLVVVVVSLGEIGIATSTRQKEIETRRFRGQRTKGHDW
jgi:hypothetical protein